jgi:hypothetical protein
VIDYARVSAVLPTARARLFAIPGVHAVGMGRKIVGGDFTDELAVMVFVEHKRSVTNLAPEHVIPAEIEGIQTDVYESEIPLLQADPPEDTTSYKVLTGGIQIKPGDFDEGTEPGGMGAAGTLGCFIEVTNDVTSQIFAVTNFHVVGKHLFAQPTNLNWNPNDDTNQSNVRTFLTNDANPTVIPGSQVVVNVAVDDNNTQVKAFYMTGPADTPADVANHLASILSGLGTTMGNGLAGNVPPNSSTLTVTVNNAARPTSLVGPFGPNRGDNKAKTTVTVNQTAWYPPVITITLTGPFYEEGGAYLTINPGGTEPTYGTFVLVDPPTPAYYIANAINGLNITGVSAEPTDAGDTGNVVTVKGAQTVECQFTTDRRVGQAENTFISCWCCHCCDYRIGQVEFARLHLDLALIHLDPGKQYQATIPGIGSIVGTYDISQDLANNTPTPLSLRGRSSTQPTKGTLLACNTNGMVACRGYGISGDAGPPPRHMLIRYYNNAFQVKPTSDRFSREGDSGAAIVTDPQGGHTTQVAGIVFAGSPQMSLGTPIGLILDAVTAWQGSGTTTTLVADTTGQPQTVPTPPGEDPKYTFAPDDTMARVAHRAIPAAGPEAARLTQVQQEIGATPAGRQYGALIMRHLDEAQTLVNTNKKMATVWHRNGGPTIIEGLLRMLQAPGQRIPPMINGTPLEDCLQQIASALARFGSDALAADIRAYAFGLTQLAHLTYPELLTALSAVPA